MTTNDPNVPDLDSDEISVILDGWANQADAYLIEAAADPARWLGEEIPAPVDFDDDNGSIALVALLVAAASGSIIGFGFGYLTRWATGG